MTVLRELVARLGFEVDGTGFQRAETAVNRVRTGLNGLAQAAASIGLVAGLKKVVTLASDARETMNVIEQVFGPDGAKRISEWSQTVGTEVGRSQFTLREFVGTLGAMLDPMVQNTAKAEEMSTSLAQLAVDLSSFFNTSEKDALIALKAGLVGETEPLRRYGVSLIDATLQEFAHARGINKKVQSMTTAEKTELRYAFIMANTVKAQGDAARTANDFANASRAVKDRIKDLATEAGLRVMPVIKRLLLGFRDGLDTFAAMAKQSNVLQSAFYVLSGVAALLAANMLAPFLLPAAAIAALILLLDDLSVMFEGGTSVVGYYIDKVFGIGATDAVIRNHATGVAMLSEAWGDVAESLGNFSDQLPDVQWTDAINPVNYLIRLLNSELVNAFARALDAVSGFVNDTIAEFRPLAEMLSRAGIAVSLPKFDTHRADRLAEQRANSRLDRDQPKTDLEFGTIGRATGRGMDADVERIQFGRKAVVVPTFDGSGRGMRVTDANAFDFAAASGGVVSAARRTVASPAAPAPSAAAGAPNITINNGPVSVQVGGGTSPQDMERIRRAVNDALERRQRSTISALRGGS